MDRYKRSEAVNIMNEDFYIRHKNSNVYILMSKDIYLKDVLNNIDKILKSNKFSLSISKIIFDSLKMTFNVSSIFCIPNTTSVTPSNDNLYDYISDYIKSSKEYTEKFNLFQKRNIAISEEKKKIQEKDLQYFLYRTEKKIRFDNIDRWKGFRFYS